MLSHGVVARGSVHSAALAVGALEHPMQWQGTQRPGLCPGARRAAQSRRACLAEAQQPRPGATEVLLRVGVWACGVAVLDVVLMQQRVQLLALLVVVEVEVRPLEAGG
eukprot:scaffold69118_cov37-Phaeocystis_antarctica.AAC.1